MNKTNYSFLIILFVVSFFLIFQSLSYEAKTGDKVLDQKLKEINSKAIRNLDDFKKEMAFNYQTSESDISEMLKIMEPAEILFTYEISIVSSNSVDKIIKSFKKHKKEGWKVIIRDMGIYSNSEKFKDLKNLSIYKREEINKNPVSQNK